MSFSVFIANASRIRHGVVVIDHRTRIIDPAKKTEYHVTFDMTHLTAGFKWLCFQTRLVLRGVLVDDSWGPQ